MRPCDSVSGTRCTRWTPRLPLEDRVRAVALDLERRLAEAALVAAGRAQRLGLVAEPLGIGREHAVDVAREERRLVAAGAGPQLDDDVAAVVRVALDEREPQLVLDGRERLLAGRELGLEVGPHLGVALALEHPAGVRDPLRAARQRCPSAACSLSSLCRRPSCAIRCRSDETAGSESSRSISASACSIWVTSSSTRPSVGERPSDTRRQCQVADRRRRRRQLFVKLPPCARSTSSRRISSSRRSARAIAGAVRPSARPPGRSRSARSCTPSTRASGARRTSSTTAASTGWSSSRARRACARRGGERVLARGDVVCFPVGPAARTRSAARAP